MTEQYQQNNINAPRGSRAVGGSTNLTLDDDLVVVDSSLNPVSLILPNAEQIPGNPVYIKAPFAGVNPVTLIGLNGQLIDGSPTLVLNTNEESALLKSDGANWQLITTGGGGGGGFPEVQDEGATVVPAADTFNFVGPGVSVTQSPAGTARVDVPGGSLPPLQSATFADNSNQDLTLGPDTNGYYAVEANISKSNGQSTSYRIDVAVSSTPAADLSVLIVDSDVLVTDIDITAVIVAGQVTLRLVGTGTGVTTTVNYRIVDSIVRAF